MINLPSSWGKNGAGSKGSLLTNTAAFSNISSRIKETTMTIILLGWDSENEVSLLSTFTFSRLLNPSLCFAALWASKDLCFSVSKSQCSHCNLSTSWYFKMCRLNLISFPNSSWQYSQVKAKPEWTRITTISWRQIFFPFLSHLKHWIYMYQYGFVWPWSHLPPREGKHSYGPLQKDTFQIK